MKKWFNENIQAADVLAGLTLLAVLLAVMTGHATQDLLKEATIAVFAFIGRGMVPTKSDE